MREGLQCADRATAQTTYHQNLTTNQANRRISTLPKTRTLNVPNFGVNYVPTKRTAENSIILSRRHQGSQGSLGTSSQSISSLQPSISSLLSRDSPNFIYNTAPEGYIQEHYSPNPTRKLLKANSVDTVNLHQKGTLNSSQDSYLNVANIFLHSRAKSTSPLPQDITRRVQFLEQPSTVRATKKQSPNIIDKLFGRFTSVTKDKIKSSKKTTTKFLSKPDNSVFLNTPEEKHFLINRKQFKSDGILKRSDECICERETNDIQELRKTLIENFEPRISTQTSSYFPTTKESSSSVAQKREFGHRNVAAPTPVVVNSNKDKRKLKYSPPPESTSTKRNVVIAESTEKVNRIGDNASKVGFTGQLSEGCCARVFAKMFGGGLKLKERLVVGACVAAVLFTLILVIDVQMDLGISGHHVVPSHGRIRYNTGEDAPEAAYNSFRKRFLQKTHR